MHACMQGRAHANHAEDNFIAALHSTCFLHGVQNRLSARRVDALLMRALGADALSVGPHERREVAPLSCRRPLQPQQTRRVDRDPHVPHHNHPVVLTVFPRCPCAGRGRNQWPCAQSHHQNGQNAQSHDLHAHKGRVIEEAGLQVYQQFFVRPPMLHHPPNHPPTSHMSSLHAPHLQLLRRRL